MENGEKRIKDKGRERGRNHLARFVRFAGQQVISSSTMRRDQEERERKLTANLTDR